MNEPVVCPDCGRDVDCWDGDYSTVLEVHSMQDCTSDPWAAGP